MLGKEKLMVGLGSTVAAAGLFGGIYSMSNLQNGVEAALDRAYSCGRSPSATAAPYSNCLPSESVETALNNLNIMAWSFVALGAGVTTAFFGGQKILDYHRFDQEWEEFLERVERRDQRHGV